MRRCYSGAASIEVVPFCCLPDVRSTPFPHATGARGVAMNAHCSDGLIMTCFGVSTLSIPPVCELCAARQSPACTVQGAVPLGTSVLVVHLGRFFPQELFETRAPLRGATGVVACAAPEGPGLGGGTQKAISGPTTRGAVLFCSLSWQAPFIRTDYSSPAARFRRRAS